MIDILFVAVVLANITDAPSDTNGGGCLKKKKKKKSNVEEWSAADRESDSKIIISCVHFHLSVECIPNTTTTITTGNSVPKITKPEKPTQWCRVPKSK